MNGDGSQEHPWEVTNLADLHGDYPYRNWHDLPVIVDKNGSGIYSSSIVLAEYDQTVILDDYEQEIIVEEW